VGGCQLGCSGPAGKLPRKVPCTELSVDLPLNAAQAQRMRVRPLWSCLLPKFCTALPYLEHCHAY
jgi:hypothetical protein